MNNNDYILGYKINERLSYVTLYHLYYILSYYVTKTFYSICLIIIKEILFVKMHGKEKRTV